MIQFFQRKQINTKSWDDVIANSPAETIYPYSWYLDAVAGQWSAYVMDDYRYVMPVIWGRKFGIRYAFHPAFVQQLGVFSKEFTDPVVVRQFLQAVRAGFAFGNLQFNSRNLVGHEPGFEVSDRVNYELRLDRDYESLFKEYSENARRNLKKAMDHHPEIREDITIDELIRLKKETGISKRSGAYIQWMKNLFASLQDQGRGRVAGVGQDGRLVAGAFFAFSMKRAIYLLSASGEAGMDTRAMFAVVDHFIRKYAGSGIILDFEGSNIPSIARFFAGFGARPATYQAVGFDRLPVSIRKLRKNG